MNRPFGDAGLVIDAVAGAATVGTWTVVLDPAQPPAGDVYQAYQFNLLQVTVRLQVAHVLHLPLVARHD